jgi:hypothetical protein
MIESLKSLAMTRVPKLALFRKFSDVAVDDEIRVALLDKDQQCLAVKGALEAYEKAASSASTAALRRKAQASVKELSLELDIVTRRLERRVLEQKRQQVYADGQRALLDMPLDEFKARSAAADWDFGLEGLLIKIKSKCKADGYRSPCNRGSRGSASSNLLGSVGESMGESMGGALVNDDTREERLVQRRQLRARSLGYELDVEMSSPVALASARQDEDCEAAAEAIVAEAMEEVVAGAVDAECQQSGAALGGAGQMVTAEVDTELLVAELLPEVMPELLQLMQPVPALVVPARPVVPSVVAPSVPGIRMGQRMREDELLVQYEQMHGNCSNARQALSLLISVPLGTLDGMLSRSRKRRKVAEEKELA